jgi:phosphonate transport system ATP-binding protein
MRDIAEAPAPALRFAGVAKSFGGAGAVCDVSFSVLPGEFVALLGPSGAGKSTILRIAAGLVQPEAGEVEVLGRIVTRLKGGEMKRFRRRAGLVYQQFNLAGRLSCLDNVLIGRLAAVPFWRVALRRFASADRQAALGALDRVGLLPQAYQRADTLSGGQQQRAAIARVLAQNADIILADEPVSSLDPETAVRVLGLLRDVGRERGLAVLCVLHQVDLARRFADRIIGIRTGRVVTDKPAALFGADDFRAVFQSNTGGSARGDGFPEDHIQDFHACLDRTLDRA